MKLPKTYLPQECAKPIIWLTGPSGAGKTTLSKAVTHDVIRLDGDQLRECWKLGFSREDRKENNQRIAHLARILSFQKTVIVSVIAPAKDARDMITNICHPFWIYVSRSLPEREGHFYEISYNYFNIDNDCLDEKQASDALNTIIGGMCSG